MDYEAFFARSPLDEVAEPVKAPLRVIAASFPISEPPGIVQKRPSLQDQNEALALENARLAHENMMLQNARLLQENMMRRMQVETLAAGAGMVSPQQWWGGQMDNPWSMAAQAGYPTYSPAPAGYAPPGQWNHKKPAAKKADVVDDESTSSGSASASPTRSNSAEDKPEAVVEKGALASTPAHLLTTVMMRNIPNNYSREMLIELIDNEGFKDCYDLVYLPIDFKNKVGLGYSFINLVDSEIAKRFHVHFSGFQRWSAMSDKVCEVTWSNALQGIDAHVKRYRDSPVMHETVPDEFKPALFKDGKRVPFPEPSRPIRQPRQWPRRH